MSLIPWRPFDELDELFSSSELTPFRSSWLRRWGDFATDMYDEGNNLIIEMHIPAVKREDIQVNVKNHGLHVSVIRQEREEKNEKKNYYFHEIRRGEFERALPLPENVLTDDVAAEYQDGVLRITLPRQQKAERAKKILVQAGGGQQGS